MRLLVTTAFLAICLYTTAASALTPIPGGMKYEVQGNQIAVLLDRPVSNDKEMLRVFSLAIKGVFGKSVTLTKQNVELASRNGKTGLRFSHGKINYYFLPIKDESGQMYAFGMFKE